LLAEPVATVSADVEEGADLVGPVADHDDALRRDLYDHELTWTSKLRYMSRERPLPEEDTFDLTLEHVVGRVVLAGESGRRRRAGSASHR
jgi:hypothetical protein